MITNDKIIEIFCATDEFNQFFVSNDTDLSFLSGMEWGGRKSISPSLPREQAVRPGLCPAGRQKVRAALQVAGR